MSRFTRLSESIGATIHKATKQEQQLGVTSAESITDNIMYDLKFRNAVKEIVNHTIKNTGDNE